MKYLWGIAFGVVCGLLGAGLLLLVVSQPRGEAIQLIPPPTEAPLVVHITGAVVNPGVYSQLPGSRVMDVINAAGGVTVNADTSLINLAKPVEDGMQIWVPGITANDVSGENPEKAASSGSAENETQAGSFKELININIASQEELETLSGIGPVTARAIIQYRQDNGPFIDIEAIQDVSGIGPVTFEKIKDSITVGAVAEN